LADSSFEWHLWDRLKLRTIPPSQLPVIEKRLEELKCYGLQEPSATDQSFIHRLVLLLWVDETEFARRLFEESKYHFRGESLEEFLFQLVVCVRERGWRGWFFDHPEYGSVQYCTLWEPQAFKLSTTPLSELLKMDNPCFSSIDGLMDIKFDKSELEKVANLIPQEFHQELRLPLILLGPLRGDYQGKYKLIGGKLEDFLLQNLLKLTTAPFDKFKETDYGKLIGNISTLKRRKFKTIYKVFFEFDRSEMSGVWLSSRYDHPYWK